MAPGMAVSVLAFAGSLRKASLNKKLVALAADNARARGADVDLLDFAAVAMPLYDGDLEATSGLPEGALALRRRVAAARAVILASPEYNASIPGTVKNAIDWTSRPPDQPWRGKVVLLLSATGGMGGGARVLPELRKVLSALGAIVVPSQVGVPKAGEAFDEHGRLKLDVAVASLDRAVGEVLSFAERLGPA
jgi:chromate reductase, NAD(P)H dehydrogenase (quinone)